MDAMEWMERTQLLHIFWHGGKWWQRWNESDICLARANWLHIKCSRSRFFFFSFLSLILLVLLLYACERIFICETHFWLALMLERHHTHKIGVRKGWRLTLQTRHNQCKKKRNKLTIYNFHTMSTLYSVLTRKWNDNENTNRNCRYFYTFTCLMLLRFVQMKKNGTFQESENTEWNVFNPCINCQNP